MLCEYYYSNVPMFTSESAFENNLSEILKESGLNFSVENQFKTGKGICNIFIEKQNKREVFVLELKYNKTSKEGMKQIVDNNYSEKYIASRNVVFSISINYNQVAKTINSFGYIINKKKKAEIEKHFKVSISEEDLLINSIVAELKSKEGDTNANLND